MLNDFSIVVESENINTSIVLIARPFLEAMKNNKVILGLLILQISATVALGPALHLAAEPEWLSDRCSKQ